MGKVITISQSKGGSCKTTTAINLCGALNELGYKSIVLDMDKDKPDAMEWLSQGKDNANGIKFVEPLFSETPSKDIQEYKKIYDYIILDTPPNYMKAAFKAVLMADFIILPCSPSFLDQHNLVEAMEIPQESGKPFKLLISKFQKRHNLSNTLQSDVNGNEIGFKSVITSKSKIVESPFYGEWIGTFDKGSESHKEFISVAKEIVEVLSKSHV
ncbi:ParA family protein [Francisellaceae bacterium CB300]